MEINNLPSVDGGVGEDGGGREDGGGVEDGHGAVEMTQFGYLILGKFGLHNSRGLVKEL